MTVSSPPATSTHWATIAERWAHLGHPLRPSEDDLVVVDRAVRRCGPGARVLVLGATPEMGVRWPDASVVAVDHTAAMLRHLWSGRSGTAAVGEWLGLPVAPAAVDVAVCDGGLHLVDDLDGQRALLAEVARVLRPGGHLVLRLFGRAPSRPVESVEDVLADLTRGAVPDPHCLKLRLWSALAGPDPARTPVAVAEVWEVLRGAHPDLDHLSTRLGWDPDGLRSFASYERAPDRYRFVPFDEVVSWCAGEGGAFTVEARIDGPGPLGDCCPTVVVRRRA